MSIAILDKKIVSKMIDGKIVEALQDLVEALYSDGLLSYEDYRKIILELVEATRLKGHMLKKKLKEIEEMIRNASKKEVKLKDTSDEELIRTHRLVEALYSDGLLSYEDYRKIILELVEATRLRGNMLKKKLKEIEEMIRNAKREFR